MFEKQIKNFKSIKSLEIDCKRVNLLIGAPNVGKSNILEALSLFNVPYVFTSKKQLGELVRFLNLKNLYYDNLPNENIEVLTDIGLAVLRYLPENGDHAILISSNPSAARDLAFSVFQNNCENAIATERSGETMENVYSNGNIKLYYDLFDQDGVSVLKNQRLDYYSAIRKYTFRNNAMMNNGFRNYLLPPDGKNLIALIQDNSGFFNEISSFFEDYGLELLYDVEKNSFEIQKKI